MQNQVRESKMEMGISTTQLALFNQKRIEKWESIYKEQSRRWNGLPSKLAETTLKFIYYKKIGCIADIGGGYGRDSIFFLKYGYEIINLESSETALSILEKDYREKFPDMGLSIVKGDALDLANYNSIVSSSRLIFCNYFLHLLSLEELNAFFKIFNQQFSPGTLISFNLISKKDFRYNGRDFDEVENDIHWSFWGKDDITNLISNYSLNVLFWEEEVEIEYINKQCDKVYTHFIIAEIK